MGPSWWSSYHQPEHPPALLYELGIGVTILQWFHSYLSWWSEELNTWVPKNPGVECLGDQCFLPLYFNIYMKLLRELSFRSLEWSVIIMQVTPSYTLPSHGEAEIAQKSWKDWSLKASGGSELNLDKIHQSGVTSSQDTFGCWWGWTLPEGLTAQGSFWTLGCCWKHRWKL